jgi:polar amino acid transport system substrate-binding protein
MKRKHFNRTALISLALAATGFWGIVHADGLDDIKARKKIVIAIDLSIPPYGVTDDKIQPAGSDVETARLLAKDLGVELEIQQTTGANRIPYLLTNKVDLVMAAFGISDERKKVIAFSKPYGLIDTSVGARKALQIKSMDDLVGKKVGVTRGTINDVQITSKAPKGVQIVRFDDDSSSVAAFVSGQVDAFVTASALVEIINSKNPGANMEPKFSLTFFPYAAGMRQGEGKLKTWIDEWVVRNTDNGKLSEIFQKWTKKPLDVTELKKFQQ